jgi:hypothetical protein
MDVPLTAPYNLVQGNEDQSPIDSDEHARLRLIGFCMPPLPLHAVARGTCWRMYLSLFV